MNLNKLDIILHIGYHKTGTTFLQKNVFSGNPEIFYLGRSWISNKLDAFFFDFNFLKDSEFDKDVMIKRFAEIVNYVIKEQNIDMSQKKIMLISHESLHSGSDYFGLRTKEQAYRLKQVFPKAKIIIGIRNQIKMIESNYTNYIHHGGKLTFNYFFHHSDFYNLGLKEKLKYDGLIDLYFEYFKKERVHILIFEQVFSRKNLNLNALNSFLNVETRVNYSDIGINKKLSSKSISILRILNCILVKDFNLQYRNRLQGRQSYSEKLRWYIIKILKNIEELKFIPSSKKIHNFINDSEVKQIEEYFEASNCNLAEQTKINLRQFGYKY